MDERWHPAFQAEVSYGLAFGQGRPEEGRLCDALLCFREESRLFKVNFAQLLQGLNRNFYAGTLSAAYEQKPGNSPFSLQLELTGMYEGYGNDLGTYRDAFVEVGLEPRYYYNLKKRIAQGKTADNLSANYLTLRMSRRWEVENRDQNTPLNDFEADYDYLLLTPAWGFQRRIFKHGYIGYQIGIGIGTDLNNSGSVYLEGRSDFKLGLAF